MWKTFKEERPYVLVIKILFSNGQEKMYLAQTLDYNVVSGAIISIEMETSWDTDLVIPYPYIPPPIYINPTEIITITIYRAKKDRKGNPFFTEKK